MNCTECTARPPLRRTGWSQEINKQPEWKCPVCDLEYWYQEDGTLAPRVFAGKSKPADKGGKVTWAPVYKFKGHP